MAVNTFLILWFWQTDANVTIYNSHLTSGGKRNSPAVGTPPEKTDTAVTGGNTRVQRLNWMSKLLRLTLMVFPAHVKPSPTWPVKQVHFRCPGRTCTQRACLLQPPLFCTNKPQTGNHDNVSSQASFSSVAWHDFALLPLYETILRQYTSTFLKTLSKWQGLTVLWSVLLITSFLSYKRYQVKHIWLDIWNISRFPFYSTQYYSLRRFSRFFCQVLGLYYLMSAALDTVTSSIK